MNVCLITPVDIGEKHSVFFPELYTSTSDGKS